jgi:predicted transcriptional regulator of viral defense system
MTQYTGTPPDLPDWVDDLQAQGRYTFTREDALAATGNTEIAVAASLRRLRKAGRIVSPRRGFHVIVPLEYRATGAPPAEWFIDDLMRHLGRPYYVGLLSAAALYGAAHHAPQVFQVVTDVPTRPLTVGRIRVVFVQGRAAHSPTETMNTATGTMRVSTPEATALDLVRHASACGGLQNVAGVLREVAERLDGARLVDAAKGVERTVAQRLGWLLDHLGASERAEPLARALAAGTLFPAALRPDLPDRGLGTDPRWGVIANATIEEDE